MNFSSNFKIDLFVIKKKKRAWHRQNIRLESLNLDSRRTNGTTRIRATKIRIVWRIASSSLIACGSPLAL